jgi:hypothetical protein
MAKDAGYDLAPTDDGNDPMPSDGFSEAKSVSHASNPSAQTLTVFIYRSKHEVHHQSSPDAFLNPLAIYRMACKDIQAADSGGLSSPSPAIIQQSPSHFRPTQRMEISAGDSGDSNSSCVSTFPINSMAPLDEYIQPSIMGVYPSIIYGLPSATGLLGPSAQDYDFEQPMVDSFGDANTSGFLYPPGSSW